MKIILTQQCELLSGALNKNFGYFIVRRKSGFYSQRSKHSVPSDGHWRFIVACAELAGMLHIADIIVSREELSSALREAHHFVAADHLKLDKYRAADILNLKTTFSL